ncbi:fam-l protein [Plasmodium malariae]|uniref:Fam-l protein n=1 Tax=Plasmodium malariae TaxID=5858 RepID=A0A1D3JI81_PLAMA|nr:fam-l protein [Plasmodium malariae]SBT86076.1 fam-l protein [Plasmodium malariae]
MKQYLKSILFIKISVFVLVTWISDLNDDIMKFNKSLDKIYKFHRKIDTRNDRLLANYKKNKDSIITGLKEEILNNEVHESKDLTYKEKEKTGQKKLSCKYTSRNGGVDVKAMRNKYCTFETKKYSNMEKKIFKELDYVNFLQNNRTISDKTYKKIIHKKYGLKLAIPVLLFLFFLIVFIVDFSLGFSKTNVSWERSFLGLWPHLKELTSGEDGWLMTVLKWLEKNTSGFWRHYGMGEQFTACNLCKTVSGSIKISETCILGQLFGYIFYFVPFIILGVTFISWIIYYHKKVKKYQNIKLRKR